MSKQNYLYILLLYVAGLVKLATSCSSCGVADI